MPATPQPYSTESFEELVSRISAGTPTSLVFIGSDKQKRQEALATLTDHLPYNLHQVQTNTLVTERYIETQGNLREMFDGAGEAEGNILVFENADALYEVPGAQEGKRAGEDEEAMSPIEYVFERIGSFKGVVVLIFQDQQYTEHTSQQDNVDYVVTF